MEVKIKEIIDKEVKVDIVVELDELEWENLKHEEKQVRFQESLKRSSEIVAKWPEWKRNVLGPVEWKYKLWL